MLKGAERLWAQRKAHTERLNERIYIAYKTEQINYIYYLLEIFIFSFSALAVAVIAGDLSFFLLCFGVAVFMGIYVYGVKSQKSDWK